MPEPDLHQPTRIGAAFWVQRTDWPSLREAVEAAEAGGADDLWIDDHLLSDEGDSGDPKFEAWSTIAAVAAVTKRARVGHLVAANTFRNPGLTAKLATTLDHISGGRAILGVGGGWFEQEHEAFGIDFGSGFGERLDRLAESVEVIRRLLDGERVTHEGRFFRLRDALAVPRPIQPHLPILIGGSGPQKTLRIVARHADLWNAYGSPASLAASDAILRDRCAEASATSPGSSGRSTSTWSCARRGQRRSASGGRTPPPTGRARGRVGSSWVGPSRKSRRPLPSTPVSASATRS
ncbi:MAG TPA: LLM class flavin-dependent oxidoreductase [Candidatus Limnocylindrales bacterium]